MPNGQDHRTPNEQLHDIERMLKHSIQLQMLTLTLQGVTLKEVEELDETFDARDDAKILAMMEKLKSSTSQLKEAIKNDAS